MFEAHDVRARNLKADQDLLAVDGDIEAAVSVHMGAELPVLLGRGGKGSAGQARRQHACRPYHSHVRPS